eukprot:2087088-Pleurochrysis_carterae.AAC.2
MPLLTVFFTVYARTTSLTAASADNVFLPCAAERVHVSRHQALSLQHGHARLRSPSHAWPPV